MMENPDIRSRVLDLMNKMRDGSQRVSLATVSLAIEIIFYQ